MVVEGNNRIYKLFDDRYRVIHHLLFWLVLSVDYIILLANTSRPQETATTILINFSIDVLIIYISLYVFTPNFLLKNKFWLFVMLILLGLIFAEVLELIIEKARGHRTILDARHTRFIIINIIWNLQNQALFVGAAVGLKLFKIWIKNQQKIQFLENTNLVSELEYLKSQINPHFLFNTLNNIYVQTKLDSKRAAQTIMKLSELLRYQLYECTKEKVFLAKEIEYLKNYLDLDRIRKTTANVNFEVEGHVNGKTVYPFIFLPFFENAVKHGIDDKNESNIKVKFEALNNIVKFSIENTKKEIVETHDEGGLGLKNIKRRLELLYPKKHLLTIDDKGNRFIVNLVLEVE
ncbi:MAG: histidine kinase [Bacteroidales bacterium]|nr:histidine kinase [Bacteroidales bacterium]